MRFVLNKVCLMLFALPVVVQCQRERDKYYEDPGWSGKPIYEVLQEEGRFGQYLQCVDKTMYATLLKGNGLWTVFAPNDEAFAAYFTDKPYSSAEEMPQSEAEKIVAYSMLYNEYTFDRLSDVLSKGWDTLKSVKKKTAYYETLHREYYRNDSVWVLNPLTPEVASVSGTYKYLPFYLSRYFMQVPLTSKDYETFYPTSTYTGRNVQAASVLEQDLQASNGVVHEVDRVNEPLPTLEDILQGEQYSKFKALIDLKNSSGEPYFYAYRTSAELTEYFKTAYPSWNISQVYAKFYVLDVPLSCERFWEAAEEESNGYTLFAPNNTAMETFRQKIEDEYGYASLDLLPQNVIGYFINAQMVRSSMIWPSRYKGAKNESENYINGEGEKGRDLSKEDYPDIRPASNGFFYGSNTYVKSHYFETVLTEVLLQPSKYLFMYNALQKYFLSSLWEDFVKCPLNGYTEENYTVLLLSDEQLQEDGFAWEWVSPSYGFRHKHEASGTTFADARIQRLIRSHVFKRMKPNGTDNSYKLDFTANTLPEYDSYGYAVNDYGDMIRYKGGKIQMLGNYDNSEWVEVHHERDFMNGQIYTVSKPLKYSKECLSSAGCEERDMLNYLKEVKTQNANVSMALDYLIFFAENTKNQYVLNKESFWTILLPNNAAIAAANVDQGSGTNHIFPYLPPLSGLKNGYDQATLPDSWMDDMDQAINFFKYHLIPGMLFLDDGYPKVLFSSGRQQDSAVVATTLKTEINFVQTSTFVSVKKGSDTKLIISTQEVAEPLLENRTVSVTRGASKSNLFGAKAVIHEVDGFLAYKPDKEAGAGD
ncbi:MAG: fasciclin domain-containing protein [Prevotellaceae bacterium]|jgi:uncharacterized surface protein with fasciclin (FAS1) repeats|nr:fasciclin domain-containing protein [Prevotellaceae bacterium]